MENLIYFLVWAAAIFLMMRFGCGAHVAGHSRSRGNARNRTSSELRWIAPESDIDPVCGKTVQTNNAKSAVHDGRVYYFCSRDCRERFEAAPQTYLSSLSPVQTEMEASDG